MSKTDKGVYGTFTFGNKEFAIQVSCIREVVNPPKEYTPIPLTSKNLLGMFNLRGTIIPVLGLSKILGEDSLVNKEDAKIAIVEYEKYLVGLLFDRTAEVVKVSPSQLSKVQFQSKYGNSDSEFLKLEEGNKMLQVLDVKKLIEREALLELDQTVILKNQVQAHKKNRGPKRQCITFHSSNALCALRIESIQEIIKINEFEESDLAYQNCIGMIRVRGRIVPIIDFSSYLEQTKVEIGANKFDTEKKVIVMKNEKGLFGLLVDVVDSIVSYYDDEILPLALHTSNKAGILKGCLHIKENEEVIIIEDKFILADSFISECAEGHRKIYEGKQVDAAAEAKNSKRRTLLTFNLNKLFGVEISSVKEIIDFNGSLMRPAELAEIYKGVLNLRGDLVLIVDPRTVYGLTEQPENLRQKILIMEKNKQKYGFLVDSVNEIINVTEGNLSSEVPAFFKNDPSSLILKDVCEMIQVSDSEHQKKTLMVLGVNELLSHVVSEEVAPVEEIAA